MCEPVEQRRRHHGVAKYGDPFGKRQVCCDEERCFFVELADQMEQ